MARPATTINAELAEPAEKRVLFCVFCGFCVECSCRVAVSISLQPVHYRPDLPDPPDFPTPWIDFSLTLCKIDRT